MLTQLEADEKAPQRFSGSSKYSSIPFALAAKNPVRREHFVFLVLAVVERTFCRHDFLCWHHRVEHGRFPLVVSSRCSGVVQGGQVGQGNLFFRWCSALAALRPRGAGSARQDRQFLPTIDGPGRVLARRAGGPDRRRRPARRAGGEDREPVSTKEGARKEGAGASLCGSDGLRCSQFVREFRAGVRAGTQTGAAVCVLRVHQSAHTSELLAYQPHSQKRKGAADHY